jgi:hypothetical protein
MKGLTNRLAALETEQPNEVRAHRIIQGIGQTRDEALNSYGCGNIAPGDLLIVRRIVEPGREG